MLAPLLYDGRWYVLAPFGTTREPLITDTPLPRWLPKRDHASFDEPRPDGVKVVCPDVRFWYAGAERVTPTAPRCVVLPANVCCANDCRPARFEATGRSLKRRFARDGATGSDPCITWAERNWPGVIATA